MLDQLCTQAIEILKQTGTRRSANALFDVFYQMWAEGGFDGYGQSTLIKDEWGFSRFFYDHGNREIADMTKQWYVEHFGKRAPSTNEAVTTCSVGDLLKETEKAYCFHGGKYTNGRYGLEPVGIWVPKSQVEYNAKNQTVTMPVWLAIQTNHMTTN